MGGQDSGIESYELESIRGVVVPEKDLGSPDRCKNCLMRLIENQCISVSLAASVLRLEMHAK